MNGRLIAYLGSLVVVVIALEFLVRFNEASFESVSDKFELRARVIESQSNEAELIFLGTSRFLDGIDDRQFSKALAAESGQTLRSFNAALAGSDVERIAEFVRLAAAGSGTRYLVVEASTPAFTTLRVDREGEVVDEPDERSQFESYSGDRLETNIRDWLGERLALVRNRTAMRPKGLANLLVISTAKWIDPNLWTRKGALGEIFSRVEEPKVEIINQFQPVVFSGVSELGEAFEDPMGIQNAMQGIISGADSSKVKLIWVVPPVSRTRIEKENDHQRNEIYVSFLKESSGIMLNYALAEMDDELFRDPTHLNQKGRAAFSAALARDFANLIRELHSVE